METDQKKKLCRLWGGRGQQTILDNLMTKYHDNFSLKKCPNCAYVSTYPIPSDQLLQRYYDQNYWQSGRLKNRVALNTLYKLRMSAIVSYIRQNSKPDSKILDWGCGDGSFDRLLQTHGYECYGLDAYAAEPDDPYIFNATIEEPGFPEGFFDIITCFNVLQHLKNPKRIREKYKGRFPLAIGVTYLILQLLAYPFAIFGSLIRHGEIIRIYVRKSG